MMAKTATKTTKQAKSWCKCFDKMNAVLEERNAALDLRPLFNFSTGKDAGFTMTVPLQKLDSAKRKPLPTVLMTYCPFCGKHLNGNPELEPTAANS